MERYLLFAGMHYYPAAFADLRNDFNSEHDATGWGLLMITGEQYSEGQYDWFYVLDTQAASIAESRVANGNRKEE